MSGFDIYCGRCGLKNSVESSFSVCEICEAPLKAPANEQEYSSRKVFALDMKKLPFSEVVSSALGWRSALSRIPSAPFVAWHVYLKRRNKEPWITPKFKHPLARFSKTSLDDIAGIDKGRLSLVTAQLSKLGFESVMDRIYESGYIPLPQRIFINTKSATYAILSFYPTRGGMWLSVAAIPKEGEKLVVVSNMQPDYFTDSKTRCLFVPGAGINGLLAALELEAPQKRRAEDRLSLTDLLIELAASHSRIFENGIETGLLTGIEKSEAAYRYAENESSSECANHPGVIAVCKCDVCGETLCGVCSIYDAKTYCENCLPEYADKSGAPPIDFSGDLRPAGFFIRSSIRLFEIATFLWLGAALFPSNAPTGSLIAYQMFFLTGFIAYFLFFVSRYGGTPLQRLAGISVIDSLGERLMFSSVLTRAIYFFGSMITFIPALGYLPAIWDKYRRGWHDRMSGTIVITTNPKVKEVIGAVALIFMLLYGGGKTPAIYQFVVDNLTFAAKKVGPVNHLPKGPEQKGRR